MLLGIHFVILGMGLPFTGTSALFLGTFWLLGKASSFLGTLKWFLGIVGTAGVGVEGLDGQDLGCKQWRVPADARGPSR